MLKTNTFPADAQTPGIGRNVTVKSRVAGDAGRWSGRPGSAAGFLLLLLAAGSGCQAPASIEEYRFQGSSMGTTFEVKVVASVLPAQQQQAVREAIQAQLRDINGKMSTYLESSEISRLNRSRETTPHPLSRETSTVLEEALRISRITRGAFDVTVGPLVNAAGGSGLCLTRQRRRRLRRSSS